MALRPPAHKLTDPAIYICEDDDAWASPIDDERRRWHAGESRYSTATMPPIDEAAAPVRWRLARCKRREYTRIQSMVSAGQMLEAAHESLRVCLRGVDGIDFDASSWPRGESMSSEDLDRLDSLVGRQILNEVGFAAMRLCSDLTDAEKKV